jgi:hypothetical protein
MDSFSKYFLFAAWVIYFASRRSLPASILLALSGAYAIIELLGKREAK